MVRIHCHVFHNTGSSIHADADEFSLDAQVYSSLSYCALNHHKSLNVACEAPNLHVIRCLYDIVEYHPALPLHLNNELV